MKALRDWLPEFSKQKTVWGPMSKPQVGLAAPTIIPAVQIANPAEQQGMMDQQPAQPQPQPQPAPVGPLPPALPQQPAATAAPVPPVMPSPSETSTVTAPSSSSEDEPIQTDDILPPAPKASKEPPQPAPSDHGIAVAAPSLAPGTVTPMSDDPEPSSSSSSAPAANANANAPSTANAPIPLLASVDSVLTPVSLPVMNSLVSTNKVVVDPNVISNSIPQPPLPEGNTVNVVPGVNPIVAVANPVLGQQVQVKPVPTAAAASAPPCDLEQDGDSPMTPVPPAITSPAAANGKPEPKEVDGNAAMAAAAAAESSASVSSTNGDGSANANSMAKVLPAAPEAPLPPPPPPIISPVTLIPATADAAPSSSSTSSSMQTPTAAGPESNPNSAAAGAAPESASSSSSSQQQPAVIVTHQLPQGMTDQGQTPIVSEEATTGTDIIPGPTYPMEPMETVPIPAGPSTGPAAAALEPQQQHPPPPEPTLSASKGVLGSTDIAMESVTNPPTPASMMQVESVSPNVSGNSGHSGSGNSTLHKAESTTMLCEDDHPVDAAAAPAADVPAAPPPAAPALASHPSASELNLLSNNPEVTTMLCDDQICTDINEVSNPQMDAR